jgi:large subunit ribosomal protein L29
MAIIRKKELKSLGDEALKGRLFDVRKELYAERGLIASGGRSSNPGKIKELKRTVARILTFLSQRGNDKNTGKKDVAEPAKKQAPAAGKA